MSIRSRLGTLMAALIAVGAVAPAAALAAPPPNDDRANAQTVGLPSTVDGTTVDATREDNELSSGCAQDGGGVWYRVPTPRAGRVIVGVAARGDLDAVIDVYRVRRSQLSSVTCDLTNDKGRTSFDFTVAKDEVYLIRVSRLENSASDSFRLTLQLGRPAAKPPGPRLPAAGATGTLNRVLNPSAAYSINLRPGVTYRFNLATRSCTPLLLYPPGTNSFNRRPVKTVGCGGYTQFTPDIDRGGLYSLLAVAPSRRGNVPYRLSAARAGSDDTAPGHFIHNYARVSGHLNSNRLDAIDLYRFDVERRSDLDLQLVTDQRFSVTLISARGRRIQSGTDLALEVAPGRYFALVRAGRATSGGYTLSRVSRTITRTRMTVDGKHEGTKVEPGQVVTLGAKIGPGVPGPVSLRVQRYDPVYGWQFHRSFTTKAAKDGNAAVRFKPPSVGRWRVRALYLGTRASSPSRSGWATWSVQKPLQE